MGLSRQGEEDEEEDSDMKRSGTEKQKNTDLRNQSVVAKSKIGELDASGQTEQPAHNRR